jgi:predicted amidohydrolase YtcJ
VLNVNLVIINANVITLNKAMPHAQAIAICDNKTVAVGSNEQILKHATKNTKTIDAKEKTIVPGLVDCHVHMTGFGYSLQQVDLRNADSIENTRKTVHDFAAAHLERPWILGGRWDQEKFNEKRYPTRRDLDEAVRDRPVFLMRVCGHIGVANTKALQLARIGRHTRVKGGRVDKDERGEPNGILRENAANLVWKILPEPTQKGLEEACESACRKAVENGLTCVHWMVSSSREIRTIQALNAEGKLPLRVILGISIEHADDIIDLGLSTGFGNDKLKIGFVKILSDGSLGARTAALNKPYSDKPDTRGIMLYSQKNLNKHVLKSHMAGLQIAIHAIGDRAVENAIFAYEHALKQCPRKDHRHRIEHCSVLSPELIKRMKKLELVASVQPHFVVSDFWAQDRLGEKRIRWVFPFRTLLNEGIIVASGSDCPVETISPIMGIWAASRKRENQEELTVNEALETYTCNAASASFDEEKRGTIEPGKLADLTMLSKDITKIPVESIKDVETEMTIVDGKVVYVRST